MQYKPGARITDDIFWPLIIPGDASTSLHEKWVKDSASEST